MQLLVKLLMIRLYGEHLREDIEENLACKAEYWIMSENVEKVKDYWKISHGDNFVKMIDDKGLEDGFKKLNTMPVHLGSYVLSSSKRITNNFIHAIDGFHTNDI